MAIPCIALLVQDGGASRLLEASPPPLLSPLSLLPSLLRMYLFTLHLAHWPHPFPVSGYAPSGYSPTLEASQARCIVSVLRCHWLFVSLVSLSLKGQKLDWIRAPLS